MVSLNLIPAYSYIGADSGNDFVVVVVVVFRAKCMDKGGVEDQLKSVNNMYFALIWYRINKK